MPLIRDDDPSSLVARLPDPRRGWTDSRRSSTLFTLLLLSDRPREIAYALDGLEHSRSGLDVKLIENLYRACTPHQRVELALAPVMSRLPPRVFERIFTGVYKWAGPYAKHRLAIALQAFLSRHPKQAKVYRQWILEMFRSANPSLFTVGLDVLGRHLDDVSAEDLRRIARALKGSKYRRLTAVHGLTLLASRERVPARVAAFLLSQKVRETVADIRAHDPFRHNRLAAREALAAAEDLEGLDGRRLFRSNQPGRRRRDPRARRPRSR